MTSVYFHRSERDPRIIYGVSAFRDDYGTLKRVRLMRNGDKQPILAFDIWPGSDSVQWLSTPGNEITERYDGEIQWIADTSHSLGERYSVQIFTQ